MTHDRTRLVLTLLGGVVIGVAGAKLLPIEAALAQINTFHAVSVATVAGGNGLAAWIIGQDGSTRYCTVGPAPQQPVCSPVRY